MEKKWGSVLGVSPNNNRYFHACDMSRKQPEDASVLREISLLGHQDATIYLQFIRGS
jgi:hypothetical protein